MNRTPKPSTEEAANDDQALELPVNPDEGSSLIPDEEERVVNVPS
ncbi:hypothetical protein [Polaromonas sp.]|nr:hypothetical protein [Polaromonas sp.]